MEYIDKTADSVSERSVDNPVGGYYDRVRWGPIFAGLVIALTTQLIRTAFGAALAFSSIAGSGAPRSNADDVGTAVGIWSIISLLISLLVGGWITARACGPMSRSTAIVNGVILWATTLAIGSWLLASGVSGAFGVVAANTGEIINQAQQNKVNLPDVVSNVPKVTERQTRDIASNAAKISWSFALGSLLGLVASMVGAAVGARSPRNST